MYKYTNRSTKKKRNDRKGAPANLANNEFTSNSYKLKDQAIDHFHDFTRRNLYKSNKLNHGGEYVQLNQLQVNLGNNVSQNKYSSLTSPINTAEQQQQQNVNMNGESNLNLFVPSRCEQSGQL